MKMKIKWKLKSWFENYWEKQLVAKILIAIGENVLAHVTEDQMEKELVSDFANTLHIIHIFLHIKNLQYPNKVADVWYQADEKVIKFWQMITYPNDYFYFWLASTLVFSCFWGSKSIFYF